MVSFNGIFLNKELMFIPPVFKLRSEMSTTALVFQNSRKFQISGCFGWGLPLHSDNCGVSIRSIKVCDMTKTLSQPTIQKKTQNTAPSIGQFA